MNNNNYYELIGVSYTATREEIKKAYLALLKQYHPDIFKGSKKVAEDFSAKLNVAFKVLADAENRLAYDKTVFTNIFTWNYYYDELGRRVPIVKSNKIISQTEYDKLPKFSFFNKSKFSERKNLLKPDAIVNKNNAKISKKQAKNIKKQQIKAQKLQVKTNKKNLVLQNKKAIAEKKALKKQKHKLNVAITVISIILAIIGGFLTYLNLRFS